MSEAPGILGTLLTVVISMPWFVYVIVALCLFGKYAGPVLKRWWS